MPLDDIKVSQTDGDMLTRLRTVLHHLNANRAAMSTVHNTNQACCSIPPVKSDYTPKGNYKPYAGFNKVCRALPRWICL